jgi:hypothetical protein
LHVGHACNAPAPSITTNHKPANFFIPIP